MSASPMRRGVHSGVWALGISSPAAHWHRRGDRGQRRPLQGWALGRGPSDPDSGLCLPGPDWASYTLGVFICLSCSGIHRNIPQVSKVKSVRLDTWEQAQVEVRPGSGGPSGPPWGSPGGVPAVQLHPPTTALSGPTLPPAGGAAAGRGRRTLWGQRPGFGPPVPAPGAHLCRGTGPPVLTALPPTRPSLTHSC